MSKLLDGCRFHCLCILPDQPDLASGGSGRIRSARGWLFILINLVMVVSAVVAGHIGGRLIFKE